jgi:acetylornithine deacetylase/succinyl-diaminopimelate desuccinylase-like protein
MDAQKVTAFVSETWDTSIVPTITEYIKIPNKSPQFDARWREHGHMHRAVALIEKWCRAQPIPGLKVEVVELEGRTPVIFMEVPATQQPANPTECVLLYGHLDKQPEMVGWSEGLGPWTPVMKGDKLFGRGGADDGYAAFASLTAISALAREKTPHARLVVLIEASEESGSPDLPYYIDALSPRIGTPSLVICLDSGCGNYDQLWCTTSLRGMVVGTLTVSVLTEGVHSGDASGVVPSSFRIARQLLDRVDDTKSGRVLLESAWVKIPDQRASQAKATSAVLGTEVWDKFPFIQGMKPVTDDLVELILNRTWRPTLSITGAGGLPAIENAGNVLRPLTQLQLSLRLPPTADGEAAYRDLKQTLERDPPYGATVTFEGDGSTGWNAPAVAPWLEQSMSRASRAFFGKDAVYMGEGGSIPFMGMLGKKFPEAQFLITGLLGPHSNAHGPNEFLHVPTGKKLTACVASVIADHAVRARS